MSKRKPDSLAPLNILNVAHDWAGKPVPELRWTLPGIIPHRQVTLLSGDGGVGKSMLAMTMLCALGTGCRFLGTQGEQIPVLGVFCEDEEEVLQIRQASIAQEMGWQMEDMNEVHLVSLVGHPSTAMASYENRYGNQMEAVEPLYEQITQAAQDLGAQFVVIDNLYNVFHGDENNRIHATHFINQLRRLALAIDGAVLLCAHPSRAGKNEKTGEAGSTAWRNAIRSMLYLQHEAAEDGSEIDKDRLVLEVKKMNYGPDRGRFELTKRNGVPVYVEPEMQNGLFDRLERRSVKRCFLDAMKTAEEKNMNLGYKPGPNYAPRVLASLSVCRGFDHRALKNAMFALLEEGYLQNQIKRDSARREREYLTLTDKGRAGYDSSLLS